MPLLQKEIPVKQEGLFKFHVNPQSTKALQTQVEPPFWVLPVKEAITLEVTKCKAFPVVHELSTPPQSSLRTLARDINIHVPHGNAVCRSCSPVMRVAHGLHPLLPVFFRWLWSFVCYSLFRVAVAGSQDLSRDPPLAAAGVYQCAGRCVSTVFAMLAPFCSRREGYADPGYLRLPVVRPLYTCIHSCEFSNSGTTTAAPIMGLIHSQKRSCVLDRIEYVQTKSTDLQVGPFRQALLPFPHRHSTSNPNPECILGHLDAVLQRLG